MIDCCAAAGVKAADAARLATRVVHPDQFDVLLRHLQPARPAPAVRPATSAELADFAPRPALVPGTADTFPPWVMNPAVVRDWAQHSGFPVGARGRLPADVVAAYQAAHEFV